MENVDFLKAHSTKLGITGDHKKYPHDSWALEFFFIDFGWLLVKTEHFLKNFIDSQKPER